MSKGKHEIAIVRRPGGWSMKTVGESTDPTGMYSSQKEAVKRAMEILESNGGGDVLIQDRHGQWRSRDTIDSSNEPYPA